MARNTAGQAQPVVTHLAEHPNLAEILGVLAQLAQITDAHVERLAATWRNPTVVAEARGRALAPDSPLVLEALNAFESLTSLFEDDLRGDAPYVTVEPRTVTIALKAVRDAIAAAYARPALSRGEHAALMRPWRDVFPCATGDAPDLGPHGPQIQALLAALPRLATRCHDLGARALWDALVDRSFVGESDRAQACESAFGAAVLTSRRRTWALVRRSGTQGLARPCPTCRLPAVRDRESERVLAVCLDAACGLLVADAMSDTDLALIVEPVVALIPAQRGPTS